MSGVHHTSSSVGALGTGEPDLRFGHLAKLADNEQGTVARSFQSEWCDLMDYNQEVTGAMQPDAWDGFGFCMKYNKGSGLRMYAGTPASSTSPITKDPTVPPTLPNDTQQVGFHDLYLANDYFDPIFKYFHVERVSAKIRLVPLPPFVSAGVDAAAFYTGLTTVGTFSVRPWFGEPYIVQTNTDGSLYPDNTDQNYLASKNPKVVVQWPKPGERAKEFHVGFLPVMPIASTANPASAITVDYQTIAPVDTISWTAGTQAQNAYLGWCLLCLPAMAWPAFSTGGINFTAQVQFTVHVRWWQFLPPLLFQIPTPRVDRAVMVEWAKKVLAADEAALKAEAEEFAESAMALTGPNPDASAAARAVVDGVQAGALASSVSAMSTEGVDDDGEMVDG